MHQNTFFTTTDVKIFYFLRTWFWWSGSMRKCIKTRFWPLQTFKKNFFDDLILVVWKCIKTRFLPLYTLKMQKRKNTFILRTWFWWSGSMRKCIRTRILPLQTLNNIIFEPMFLVVWKYAKMQQTRF